MVNGLGVESAEVSAHSGKTSSVPKMFSFLPHEGAGIAELKFVSNLVVDFFGVGEFGLGFELDDHAVFGLERSTIFWPDWAWQARALRTMVAMS